MGFDIDKKALEIAKTKDYNVYDSLEKIKGYFDIITMWEVIEHLQLEEFLDYLDYVKRHLKINGKLIISTPNTAGARFLKTKSGRIPVSLSYHGNAVLDARDDKYFGPAEDYKFAYRMSYLNQLMVARRFGNKISLQFAPTFVYYNAVPELALYLPPVS